MTHKRFTPHDPREWLQRSRSNLAQTRTQHPDVYFEDLCFQAQEATVKALKGVLVHSGRSIPYTQDIAHLISLIENEIVSLPDELEDAAALTRYAVATRYPGVIEEVSRAEYVDVLENSFSSGELG